MLPVWLRRDPLYYKLYSESKYYQYVSLFRSVAYLSTAVLTGDTFNLTRHLTMSASRIFETLLVHVSAIQWRVFFFFFATLNLIIKFVACYFLFLMQKHLEIISDYFSDLFLKCEKHVQAAIKRRTVNVPLAS